MGHLAVLLGLTGNSEEQGQEQEQGQGQEDIAAAAVELKHVSLARRYYAVTEVAAAATVTAGGDARKEVTTHGDERVEVVQQQMWAAAEEQSYWQVHSLVGGVAGSILVELGVRIDSVEKPRAVE